jgi:hypothetical protein
LALKNGSGSVLQGGNDCLHLSVGRVEIAGNAQEYYELVDAINSSAANLELHREPPRTGASEHITD